MCIVCRASRLGITYVCIFILVCNYELFFYYSDILLTQPCVASSAKYIDRISKNKFFPKGNIWLYIGY